MLNIFYYNIPARSRYFRIVEKNRRQALFLWLFVGLLAGSTLLLAGLQYRWIREVASSEQERRQRRLEADIDRLAREFDEEISSIGSALIPRGFNADLAGQNDAAVESNYLTLFESWKESAKHERVIKQLVRIVPNGEKVSLRMMDAANKTFRPIDWPYGWESFRARLMARLSNPETRGGPMDTGTMSVLEFPRWNHRDRTEGAYVREWVAIELDTTVLQQEVLPELLQRHLGGNGPMEYEAEIAMREIPEVRIYSSTGNSSAIATTADASTVLFRSQLRRGGPRGGGGGERFGGPRPGGRINQDQGRWLLSVRHKEGSLEAAVARAKTRNIALTTGILALMLTTIGALLWLTRRAQQLAYMQMEFVASISHELRTPLAVINTAAFNLGGGIVKFQNQAQVERYANLIKDQVSKLGSIVENVLRFAGTRSGQTQWKQEPLPVDQLIDEALSASAQTIAESGCTIERNVPQEMLGILGDETGLQQVLQNLISNAAKYGSAGGWIGISASACDNGQKGQVEIKVADRGAGIPKREASHIFEPFFRGKKAVENQIHGTGLGLSLTKRIVEGQGGTIAVRSEEGKGAEFVVRLPAASKEAMNEFTNFVG